MARPRQRVKSGPPAAAGSSADDHASPPHAPGGHLPYLCFLFLLTFVLHGRLLLAGKVLVGEDLSRVEAPVRAAYAASLKEGRLPVWYPRLNLGTPMFAESQVGQLHPLNLLVFRLLPAREGGAAWAVLVSFLCGLSMYALGRGVGLGPPGAALSAVVFMLSGFFSAHVNHRYTFLLQGAHAPLIVLAAERIAARRGRWTPFWAAGVIALALLAGHFQLTFIALLLYLFYGLWRARQESGSAGGWLRRSAALAAPVAAAAGLAAVQWMPTWELAQRLVRRVRMVSEMHPAQVSAYLSPYLFQARGGLWGEYWRLTESNYWESLAYVGVLPLCLALVGFGGRRRWKAAWPLGASAAGFTLLSMGAWIPGYRLLLALPGFGFFRAPGRYAFGAALCLALLAGFGLERAGSGTAAESRRRLARVMRFLAGGVLLALLVGLAAARWVKSASPGSGGEFAGVLGGVVWRWSLGLPAAVLSAAALWGLFRRRRWSRVAALLVAAGDLLALGLACQRFVVEPAPLEEIRRPGPVARRLASARRAGATGRVLCAMHTWPVDPALDRIYFGSANLPAYQAGLWELPDRPYPVAAGAMKAYGVRFYVSGRPVDDPRLDLRYAGPDAQIRALHGRRAPERVYLYACRDWLPRAYLVERAVWLDDWRAVGRAMTRTWFDPARVVLLDREAGAPERGGGPGGGAGRPKGTDGPLPPGRCRILSETPTRLRIEVAADRPAWLVLSDLFYPGWRAFIEKAGREGNDRPLTIRRANVMVRAVRVPAGRSVVRFEYRPAWLMAGAAVSAASLVLTLLAAVATAWIRRGKRTEPAGRSGRHPRTG